MNHDEKVRLLEQANIECNDGHPQSRMIVRDDWAQLITPGGKGSAANAVYRSVLDKSKVAEKVSEVCDFYESMGVAYRWVVTPLTRPVDLSGSLEARGLKLLYEASAMISSCDKAINAGAEMLRVEEVTLAQLDLYVDTFMSCWEMPPEMKDEFSTGVAASLKDPQRRFRCFIGFFNHQPVATGGLVIIASGAYLASGTVHPKYRGRGLYKSLLSHRANVAKSLGHNNLLIHAKTHTAAPICTKLGFETVYTHQVYSRESL